MEAFLNIKGENEKMKREKWLDAWRGLGCLFVFISHGLDAVGETGGFFGKQGVAILFCLSGYLFCEKYYLGG